jgi:hypothetical protein
MVGRQLLPTGNQRRKSLVQSDTGGRVNRHCVPPLFCCTHIVDGLGYRLRTFWATDCGGIAYRLAPCSVRPCGGASRLLLVCARSQLRRLLGINRRSTGASKFAEPDFIVASDLRCHCASGGSAFSRGVGRSEPGRAATWMVQPVLRAAIQGHAGSRRLTVTRSASAAEKLQARCEEHDGRCHTRNRRRDFLRALRSATLDRERSGRPLRRALTDIA